MSQQDTISLIRQLEGITIDSITWGTKRRDDEVIIYGTGDEVTLDAGQLRNLADALEPQDLKLQIDRSGAKARLTITD
jgi:hypothetical protein